jgi:hypothetical protein
MLILKHEDDPPTPRGSHPLVVERVFDILMVAVLGAIALPFVILTVLDVPDCSSRPSSSPSPQAPPSLSCSSGRAG